MRLLRCILVAEKNQGTVSVLKIKLLFKFWLHNMVLQCLQTKLVQKYCEEFAFVFKTCWLRAQKKNANSRERLWKCNHKLAKKLNGNNFFAVLLPAAFPQICWATQNTSSIRLQNTFTRTRALSRGGCQAQKRALNNIYFSISNQINEHFYLGVVLNEAGGNHISAVWIIIFIQDPYIWVWSLRDWPIFSSP